MNFENVCQDKFLFYCIALFKTYYISIFITYYIYKEIQFYPKNIYIKKIVIYNFKK